MINVFPMRRICSELVFSMICLESVSLRFLWLLNLILMSSWSKRACSISASSGSVIPLLPVITTGFSLCARPRSVHFCFVVNFCMVRIVAQKVGKGSSLDGVTENAPYVTRVV